MAADPHLSSPRSAYPVGLRLVSNVPSGELTRPTDPPSALRRVGPPTAEGPMLLLLATGAALLAMGAAAMMWMAVGAGVPLQSPAQVEESRGLVVR